MKKILITSIVAATALNAHGAAIHTGLLNYWALDGDATDTGSSYAEGTGVTADNGTVNGTAAFGGSQAGFGSAGSFPGGSGNNITVADGGLSTAGGVANDVDRTGSDMTLSVWIQAAAWDTSWQGIVSHGENTDYRLARRGGNNPVLFAGVAGTGDIVSTTSYSASSAGDGLWHHLVITSVNGGASNFYVDGLLEGTNAGPAGIAASAGNNNTLCIGCNPDNGREFNGLIDDVAIWDRALSNAEVTQIHTAGQAGTPLGAIPEPSVSLLAAISGIMMIFRRRRA